MIRAYRAELARLLRRRVVVGAALVVLVVAVAGAAIVLSSAEPAARVGSDGYSPTVESLSRAGGGTEVFRYVAAFWGTFVFVVFVGLFALDFSRGTYRTMLLRQPDRLRLLAGRMLAFLSVAAGILAAAEVATWIAARVQASGNGISTTAWTGTAALGAALSDFGIVLVWVTGYAVLAMMVAMLVRSLAVALAVGILWAGPLEHLIQNAWSSAPQVFPGLLLEAIGQRGTPRVGMTQALVTLAAYVAVAAVVSAVVFRRRDVTTA
jgi:ABC-type transport system involved in multi-copper enzyme maturation permease subunit